jgi:hypothetical protein
MCRECRVTEEACVVGGVSIVVDQGRRGVAAARAGRVQAAFGVSCAAVGPALSRQSASGRAGGLSVSRHRGRRCLDGCG